MSLTDMPLAYRDTMMFSMPSTMLPRLGTTMGLKLASLSLGTDISDSPKEVRTFFLECPLRELPSLDLWCLS